MSLLTAPPFEEALAAAQRGEPEAFSTLFRAYQSPLLRFLRGLGADLADDAASETWLAVIKDLGTFTGDERAFRSWLFTVARHRLFDQRRYEARRPTAEWEDSLDDVAPQPGPERVVLEAVGTDEAVALVRTLPPDQAEVVLLRVLGGFEVAEVARMMGRSPGSVRVLCHRGLRTLAARLSDLSPSLRSDL
jgi:RNA polymerase sigma-70 factor (ECF subfamily)